MARRSRLLTRLVSELRCALGEGGREGRLVRTIHGYGYAFAAELAMEGGPDRAPERQAWSPPRIAVLPFADLSPQQDQGYLCEGIAEELISGLTALPGLQVASRQSSFRYAAAGLEIRKIGAELAPPTLLEGTVRKAAERLHITARLLDLAADDPGSLWNIGAALAIAGETEDALSCLEPALLQCRDLPWADHDSFLDGLRGEPRFQAALAAAWARRGGRP